MPRAQAASWIWALGLGQATLVLAVAGLALLGTIASGLGAAFCGVLAGLLALATQRLRR